MRLQSFLLQTEDQLINQSFFKLTDEQTKLQIFSDIEFEPQGKDFATILNHLSKLTMINCHNVKLPVNIKAFYTTSESSEPSFELLIKDLTLISNIDSLKFQLQQNKDYQQNDETLPVTNLALAKIIELVSHFTQSNRFNACFILINIVNHKAIQNYYGNESIQSVLKALTVRFNQLTRVEDLIGLVNDDASQLGIILFNCNIEDGEKVLDRLRKKLVEDKVILTNNDMIDVKLKLSHCTISKNNSLIELVNQCFK